MRGLKRRHAAPKARGHVAARRARVRIIRCGGRDSVKPFGGGSWAVRRSLTTALCYSINLVLAHLMPAHLTLDSATATAPQVQSRPQEFSGCPEERGYSPSVQQRLEDAVQDALLVRDAQWQTTVQDALFAACCLLLAACCLLPALIVQS